MRHISSTSSMGTVYNLYSLYSLFSLLSLQSIQVNLAHLRVDFRAFLSSPRPAPLEKAPPRTSLIQVQNLLLHLISQGWHFTAYFPIILWVPKLFIICADNCYPLLIFCWSINVINFKIEIVYFPNNSVQREHLFTLCFHHQSISCQHLDICDILRPPFDIGSCQRCQHLDIHSFQNAWKGNVKEK